MDPFAPRRQCSPRRPEKFDEQAFGLVCARRSAVLLEDRPVQDGIHAPQEIPLGGSIVGVPGSGEV
jgi:hypothetical protein